MRDLKEISEEIFNSKYINTAHNEELEFYRKNNFQMDVHKCISLDRRPYQSGFAAGYQYALTDFLNRLKEALNEK